MSTRPWLTRSCFRVFGPPEFCGRLTGDLPKNPIEIRQRLETDVVSNFAHPPIRIKQLGLCPLDSYSAKYTKRFPCGQTTHQCPFRTCGTFKVERLSTKLGGFSRTKLRIGSSVASSPTSETKPIEILVELIFHLLSTLKFRSRLFNIRISRK